MRADLFGRKRAYTLGLIGYAIGAVAMTLAQSLTAYVLIGMDRHTPERFENFAAFWPYYLREHARPATRAVHVAGTWAGVAIGPSSLPTRDRYRSIS